MSKKLVLKKLKGRNGQQVCLKIDKELLDELDKLVEQVPYTRTNLINLFIRFGLDNVVLE